jgi:ankyrin repeat protein
MKKLLLLFFIISSFGFNHKEKWDDNKDGWSPLMLAVYKAENKVVSELISQNVDITYKTKGTWTLDALFVAIKSKNLYAIKELVNTQKFKKLYFYFNEACSQTNSKIVDFLIEKGIDINEYSDNGHSHLMSACISGSPEVVKSLLKNGAEVNHQRKTDGITALMLATFNGSPKTVKVLLSYSADKKIKDLNNETALDYIDQIYPRKNISDKIKIELMDLLTE